ncbi:MAG: hypothetical protein JSV56_06385 [Methanomassiliicoccales archaeon]|nr:MAG: hypothetical protein JSV56_06385 [Methanomassiliicoccales archaeon]
MKKGIYKEAEFGQVAFTDIGQKVYESAKEFNEKTKIKFLYSKVPGTIFNWDIDINSDFLKIRLISRRYFDTWQPDYGRRGLAIKITIIGDNDSINKYLKILKTKFKNSPIDFEKWDKFEKMFNVDKYEVEANWRIVEQS